MFGPKYLIVNWEFKYLTQYNLVYAFMLKLAKTKHFRKKIAGQPVSQQWVLNRNVIS